MTEPRTHAYLEPFREADADRMACYRMERYWNTCMWVCLWLAAACAGVAVCF